MHATTPATTGPAVTGRWTRFAGPVATLAGAAGVCALVALTDPTTPGGMSPPCPTKALFGIVCPGCGSARMLYSVLHGDLRAAAAYNAVGLVALVLVVWTYVAWSTRTITGRRIRRWETWRWSPVAVGVVVAVWAIIRNLPVSPFTALAV